MRRNLPLCMCAIVALTASAVAQPAGGDPGWQTLRSLKPDARVTVVLRDGKYVRGRFAAWSPQAIEVTLARGVTREITTFRAEDVRRVAVQQKSSRWKGAMVGASIGFGIAFPIGAASAGHLTDRNNPGFATRLGMGTGLGMFGAGIAAPIGALTGGTKDVTVYKVKDRP